MIDYVAAEAEAMSWGQVGLEIGLPEFNLKCHIAIVKDAAMPGTTPSQALTSVRETIRRLTALQRTVNPRIFGSVLTGSDREDSDLDVLVEPLPETTLFDLGGLQDALEDALGVRVDVKTPLDLPPHIRADVLRSAVPV